MQGLKLRLCPVLFYAELRGDFYTSQMEVLSGDPAVDVRLSPTISSRTLSDFHKISCTSPLQKLSQTNFHENRFSDSHLTLWMSFHCCQQSSNKVTLPCNKSLYFILLYVSLWVRVTTVWCVIRLRMEERPPIWRVAANILNKQSADSRQGVSSSLAVGRGANISSP